MGPVSLLPWISHPSAIQLNHAISRWALEESPAELRVHVVQAEFPVWPAGATEGLPAYAAAED